MTAFLVIVVVGMGTYLMRSAFILLLADHQPPQWTATALTYVAPAVIAALVVSLLTTPEGVIEVGVAEGAGLAAAGLAGWRTRNILPSLAAGMAMFWLVGALV